MVYSKRQFLWYNYDICCWQKSIENSRNPWVRNCILISGIERHNFFIPQYMIAYAPLWKEKKLRYQMRLFTKSSYHLQQSPQEKHVTVKKWSALHNILRIWKFAVTMDSHHMKQERCLTVDPILHLFHPISNNFVKFSSCNIHILF